jgi:hypothetical protein
MLGQERNCTFVEAVHVELAHERRDIGMLEVLSMRRVSDIVGVISRVTYARTFENSVLGDMTKLSLLVDHEIRCCIL